MTLEQAIVVGGSERQHIEAEVQRLERMLPALRRPGGHRRGQVVLGADEAWDLMAATGPRLQLAGFEVRVPELSKRASTPSLRIFVDAVSETAVGANQLANVRWSAVFDDVELTAADIARLAKEARPLIRSGSRWIAVDHADLTAAAAALAERETKQQLSGAEMLRYALGLEDSPLAGGISIDGGGGPPTCSRPRPMSRTNRRVPRRDSSANSGAIRRKRSRGSASSMPRGSVAASRSTWASGRRRPSWPTCCPGRATAPRW